MEKTVDECIDEATEFVVGEKWSEMVKACDGLFVGCDGVTGQFMYGLTLQNEPVFMVNIDVAIEMWGEDQVRGLTQTFIDYETRMELMKKEAVNLQFGRDH